jgi:chromosome segregation ATPase
LLDKATKEAEHREKLQDLLTRLSTLNEKVSAEEAALGRLKDKISEADRELGGVRAQLKNHSIRRTNLDLAETSLSLTGHVSMLQKSAAAVAAGPGSKATFIPAVEEEALQAQRLESLINRCIVSHIISLISLISP